MRITRYTDYALRVLIHTGLHDDRLCTVAEIADRHDISRNHLMKVVQALAARGYLEATRGRNGGVRLGMAAADINIGTLVRELETEPVVPCQGPDGTCMIAPACELKHALARAREAFFRTLDDYTLADLLPRRRRRQLLTLLAHSADA